MILSFALGAACGGDAEFECSDPKYGNGTCDLDTTCGAPDVDCFVTFDTPDAARSWYDQSGVAATKGPSVATSDPRFASTQALLDEGWDIYKSVYEVGDLADASPRLVLVDNDAVNAFVIPDRDRVRAGLAVMVNTGLVDLNAPKEQTLGIMMHEFEHALGLHVNPTIKERFVTYYRASATDDPLGFEQADDSLVRAKFDAWSSYAQFAGYASDVELTGLPLTAPTVDGDILNAFGALGAYFYKLVTERRAVVNTTVCTNAVNQYLTLLGQIFGTLDPVTNNLTATAAQTTTIVTAITDVRDQCWVGVTGDAVVHLARVSGIPEATIRGLLPPELATEITGKTVITGWFNAIRVARQRMREIEAAFMTEAGVPWTRLRYYSTEEAADDSSARVMTALGLAADGATRLLVNVDAKLASACNPLLAGTALIHYGENLGDDHHSTCWRVRHQQQVGADASPRKLLWRSLGPLANQPAPLLLEVARLPATSPLRSDLRHDSRPTLQGATL
jgi:hypothetical protein